MAFSLSPWLQCPSRTVVVRGHGSALLLPITLAVMLVLRTGGVLFAKDLDRVATFYSVVLGLTEANRADDHILLESPGFQLVVHRIVEERSAAGDITAPPLRRASAAFKPVFFVPSISRLRGVAETYGGVMEPADHEWLFNGVSVCDGLDPEGNVIQFREQAG